MAETCHVKPQKTYSNAYPHSQQRLLAVLRWKLGLGLVEAHPDQPQPDKPAMPDQRSRPSLRPPEASLRPSPERVRLTWIGHSTFLIQHQGRNILTDPIFGNCQPPLPLSSLRRAQPPGIALPSLPRIDDVLISHNHYDHLDAPAVKAIAVRHGPSFWLPEGLRTWFDRRRIDRCAELGWWQGKPLSERIDLWSVPAQHFSARGLFDRNHTHWCGWVMRSATRSIYFAGDTGYCPSFLEIGERFGGFDLALIPIGAYQPRWLMQPVHVDPYEAARIHSDVRSRLSVASHWGTFRLTDEPLAEPPRVLARALSEQGINRDQFLVMSVGETIDI